MKTNLHLASVSWRVLMQTCEAIRTAAKCLCKLLILS